MIKIVADSSCDRINEKKLFKNVTRVPLYIMLGDKEYLDNENLNVKELVKDIDTSILVPKTQCPSPNAFFEAFEGQEDEIFVVTLSSKLSGSYNSALLAANMFLEEYPEKKIHVFDSMSASSGEVLIIDQIVSLIEQGLNFNSIIEKIEYKIRNENKIYAVLENLTTLAKNGRLTKMQSVISSVTKIRLILTSNEGEIGLFSKAIGTGQAISKIVKEIIAANEKNKKDTIIISHCNAKELAIDLKRKLLIKANFKKIEIFETSGLSSVYANNGGLIIAL